MRQNLNNNKITNGENHISIALPTGAASNAGIETFHNTTKNEIQ